MFDAPYPPYDPTDKQGFSYTTVLKRWPVIVTGVVDQISRENHALHLLLQTDSNTPAKEIAKDKLTEGKAIIERISKLKYQMARDHALEPIPQDGEAYVDTYNTELDRLTQTQHNTWYTAPWLYAECYLYRFLRSLFAQTKHWKEYDVFSTQKMDVFKNSSASMYKIASIMDKIDNEKAHLNTDKLFILFEDMIQMCLWGNATDLSLLTTISLSDIERLQSTGKDIDRQSFILRDDQRKAWDHVNSLNNARVDFVLDNAGFELFTDLVFADFLVTYTPYVSKVVFHPKLIPWFVSDVVPIDFRTTIESLLDPVAFFPSAAPASETQVQHLKLMATRWKSHLESGAFELAVPLDSSLGDIRPLAKLAQFWTAPWPYWDMKIRDPDLWTFLSGSQLVIFKGDLNYRKLTGDVQWPAWTPLETALGPLAGSFPILSLRTNKADVVVGVEREVAEKLDASGEQWRVDGRYALISFLPRAI